jgi:hypothetical protein
MSGFDPSRVFVDHVGGLLDMPSLYMGGPSHQSRMKAGQILKWLGTAEGLTALRDALSAQTQNTGEKQ